jgi:hypothetical protein
MPRLIASDAEDSIELGDLVEMLESGPFDPDDEDCMASWGGALKRLANNRRFLGDLVLAELKERCAGQLASNHYSSQVIMLHARAKKYLIRANFWPAEADSIFVHSGGDPFFYGMPHDHNFSFLTVGYLGPGYWSDYYEYDYASVAGTAGEKVDLRFVERSRLDLGKVLLYRAHRDVHLQLPADAMSVSINILGVSPTHEFREQYQFDTERSEIVGIINRTSLEPLLALSAHFGGGEGRELLDSFAARHPSDRMRFAAVRAQAAAAGGVDARLAVYEAAARLPNRFVSTMAAREAERVAATRHWIEAGPQPLA